MAVVLQAAMAVAMVLTSSFGTLLTYVGFTLSLVAGMTVLGVFVSRWREPALPRPYRAWGYPVTPAQFLVLTTWMATQALVETGHRLGGLGAILGSLALYASWAAATRLPRASHPDVEDPQMTTHRLALGLAALLLAVPAPARPAEAAPPAAAPVHDPAHPPIDCPLHAQGVNPAALRPFEETDKYIAFLERADRALWQKPDEVVKALRLRGTETVADVGAGSGYFTFRFATALPRGKVIATDIDPEMVRHVHHKVLTERARNVTAILTKPDDPGIPAEADLVFIADVIHHVANREAWLRRAFAEMKPGARLVVVEFKEGKLPEGPPESVKIPRAKLVAMVQEAGFKLVSDEPGLLPYQTFLGFVKPAPAASSTAGNR